MSATSEPVTAVPVMEPINQLITMTFAPEHEGAFLELATAVVDQVRANEPDTLVYMLTKDPARDHTYVWIESYRNQAALARDSEAPYMEDALAKLPTWWSAPPEPHQLLLPDGAGAAAPTATHPTEPPHLLSPAVHIRRSKPSVANFRWERYVVPGRSCVREHLDDRAKSRFA